VLRLRNVPQLILNVACHIYTEKGESKKGKFLVRADSQSADGTAGHRLIANKFFNTMLYNFDLFA